MKKEQQATIMAFAVAKAAMRNTPDRAEYLLDKCRKGLGFDISYEDFMGVFEEVMAEGREFMGIHDAIDKQQFDI